VSHRATGALCDKYINDEPARIGDGLPLVTAAVGIGVEGIRGILAPDHSHHGWALPVLAAVLVVKWLLSRRSLRMGVECDTPAPTIGSWQHLTEAVMLAGAFVGISFALSGWATADDWISVGAAAFMGYNGVAILLSTWRGSTDSGDSEHIVAAVRSAATNVSTVAAVAEVQVRRSAGSYQVVIHVQAHPTISLSDAYCLGGRVKSAILHAVPSVGHVLVHVEPYDPRRRGRLLEAGSFVLVGKGATFFSRPCARQHLSETFVVKAANPRGTLRS
jgi:divalent metal cation (Fe/Co/Zn/Cd) transporter